MPANPEIESSLERLRSEARCANELERDHLLWRLSQELGLTQQAVLAMGFEQAYRRLVVEAEE